MSAEYAVELTPPDLSAYKTGNTGIDYVTRFDSGRAGPHVLINALTHGNELCGAIAVDFLFRKGFRPKIGTLTLSFANIDAFAAFDPANPSASRFVDEDFNRVWSPEVLAGPRQSVELRRARKLRPAVDAADFLLDIHSMQHKTPPLMMTGPLEKSRVMARRVATPHHIVADEGHKAGRRMRDYGGFGDPASAKIALLIECGQHWEKDAAPIAIDSALRFLLDRGLIDRATAEPHLRPLPESQRTIEIAQAVTVESENFAFARDYRGMEVIAKAGTKLGTDGERPILTPFDDCVLIMPSRRLKPGQTAVRLGRFITA
ncbi:MAG: succinylglutamate desuccinylase [Alphaproteobacteria bacterium]|nr:succinylglutamate desuccinylase [Alphaproteobacteria bacterium]